MYDKILVKDLFVKKLLDAGCPEGLVEEEYKKLEKHFEISCLQVLYERLPIRDQKDLIEGLDMSKPSDIDIFLDRARQFLEKDPITANKEDVLKEALELTYAEYAKTMKREDENV